MRLNDEIKVILISGHAQNGKDTVAKFMEDRLTSDGNRVLITHYADLVRFVCKEYFGWDGEKDEYGRTLLQYVGTDVVRKINKNFWVDFVKNVIVMFKGYWDYVIIPDTRFENEIDRMREAFSTTHVRVVRPGYHSGLTEKQLKHSSETSLDEIEPDFRIFNDGGLSELKKKIDKFIEEEIYGDGE